MNKFENLRNQYSEFIYKDYKIYDNENYIRIEYEFQITNLAEFKPIIEIEKRNIEFRNANSDFVKNIVFNLGMIELISYWKCACPARVVVKCGNLNEEQINWFKKLYYYGLRRI